MSRFFTTAISALLVIVLSSCAPDDGTKRYPLKGRIEGVDFLDRELLIAHESIPDYMPAMTMPFKMPESNGILARFQGVRMEHLRRGDVITAILVVNANASFIERVNVVRHEAPADIPAPPPKESREGGSLIAIENLPLQDQDGKTLRLSDYHGHPLALTFIYTRCPLPEFCPRIMKNFQTLESAIEGDPDLNARARLLSISFDVEFDRPEVLKAFGSAFVKDRGLGPFARWKLATGAKESIDRIGSFFGLVFLKEEEQFSHSLVTVVVGSDGKIVREWAGNDWLPEDALAALREGR